MSLHSQFNQTHKGRSHSLTLWTSLRMRQEHYYAIIIIIVLNLDSGSSARCTHHIYSGRVITAFLVADSLHQPVKQESHSHRSGGTLCGLRLGGSPEAADLTTDSR